jgi:hypothetical protein
MAIDPDGGEGLAGESEQSQRTHDVKFRRVIVLEE